MLFCCVPKSTVLFLKSMVLVIKSTVPFIKSTVPFLKSTVPFLKSMVPFLKRTRQFSLTKKSKNILGLGHGFQINKVIGCRLSAQLVQNCWSTISPWDKSRDSLWINLSLSNFPIWCSQQWYIGYLAPILTSFREQ